jgi:hypothetical protein
MNVQLLHGGLYGALLTLKQVHNYVVAQAFSTLLVVEDCTACFPLCFQQVSPESAGCTDTFVLNTK